MDRFSVLTLNLWNTNSPYEFRMNRIVEFLRMRRPNVVCMQEVSPHESRWQAEEIADQCQYHTFFSFAGTWNGRPEGIAMLTRERLSDTKEVRLPEAHNDMARVAQSASVEIGLTTIHVVNTHLAFHPNAAAERLLQAETLASLIAVEIAPEDQKVVLCGDFNDIPESPTLKSLQSFPTLSLLDAWVVAGRKDESGLTFARENCLVAPELWPDRRIDYVLFRGVEVLTCRVVFRVGSDEGIVSDHYGVIAEFSV